jgi:hypothetical protein
MVTGTVWARGLLRLADPAPAAPRARFHSTATGAFYPHPTKLAATTCPAQKPGEAHGGRQNAGASRQTATFVERRRHMLPGVGVYPEGYLVERLSEIVHSSRLRLLPPAHAHQPGGSL